MATYRWSILELRASAARLRMLETDIRNAGSVVQSRLASVGRYSPSNAALAGVATEVGSRAADFDARADFVESSNPFGVCTVAQRHLDGFGPPDPDDMRAVIETMAELQRRIDEWNGTDNDPILDEMIDDLHAMQEASGITPDGLADVALAMARGQGPVDALLPGWLFPEEYLDALSAYRAQQALVGDLEAREDELQDLLWDLRFDLDDEEGSPFDLLHRPDRGEIRRLEDAIDAIAAELSDVQQQLAEVRDDLVDPSFSVAASVAFLSATPALKGPDIKEAIGTYLADQYVAAEYDVDVYAAVAAMLVQLQDPVVAAEFFNDLGPEATAVMPSDMVRATGGYAGTDVPVVLRDLSTAFGVATYEGLSFTGAEVLEAGTTHHYDDVFADPAFLFIHGDIEPSFAASAAHAELSFGYNLMGFSTQSAYFMVLIDHDFDAVYGDSRVVYLSQAAKDESASIELVHQLEATGTLAALVTPDRVFADTGIAAGSVIANVGADVEAVKAVISVIAADGVQELQPGIAEGSDLMFVPHVSGLMQDYHVPQQSLQLEVSAVSDLPPGYLDDFLETLFASGAGSQVKEHTAAAVKGTIVNVMLAFPGDPDQLDPLTQELGEMVGRVMAAEFRADDELARHVDSQNAFNAMMTEIVAGAGVTLVLTAGGAVGVPASLLAATALDLGAGVASEVLIGGTLTGHIFPTDNEEDVLRQELSDIVNGATAYQYLTANLLVELGLLNGPGHGLTPDQLDQWADFATIAGTDATLTNWITSVDSIFVQALAEMDGSIDLD